MTTHLATASAPPAAHAKLRERPSCANCGSFQVLRDAFAVWDMDAQDWKLQEVMDDLTCTACGYESHHTMWVEV